MSPVVAVVIRAIISENMGIIVAAIFLDKHFVQGDMTRLSVFTDKLDWHIKKYFRDCVDVKVVSICKSCRKKANKKCCAQYNSANRTTALMVIGWV